MDMHAAEQPLVIPVHFLGFHNLLNPLTLSWLAFGLVFLLLGAAVRTRGEVPTGIQNFVEMVVDFLQGLAEPLVGRRTSFFLPLFLVLFLYLFTANLLGLIPGLVSPTSRADVNAALAIVVFFATHVFGIRAQGLKGYLAHFLPPPLPAPPGGAMRVLMKVIELFMIPLMVAIHLIGELAKPLSLTMRLFGNIMAKEKLLAVLVLLVVLFWPISAFTKALAFFPLLLRPLIVVLGVFVSFVQALVFTLLAIVYIGEAVRHHGHADSEEHLRETPAARRLNTTAHA